ncbi:hypothetical protein HYH03_010371 [Edaphochlamys debaryana]|uniref:Uncharacterized protein n=1 Tax=Edaphochlamys debaryana TaxID=47281 RepID=A0A835Y5E3_9CHLO|nr:hypothetical protein HYH03_010371 [Edaphochlamys debaryana]|eukprot:KAG2491374.1 hypothetical protein HYH03_010371 [Edaphochlamys debaryana]
MGNCCSAPQTRDEEDDHGEQPIDIHFSNTSVDGDARQTGPSARPSRAARASGETGGPLAFGGRYGSSRGVPSPSLSSVSLVPVARTGSYDVRVASRTRQNGGDGVIETSRLVVDHLKGNVFINQYLIIKDLGKGAHGTVKLVYNTQDDLLYAMKVIHKRRMRRQSYLAEPRAVANMMRNVGMSPLSQSQTEGHRGGPSPLTSPRAPNGMTDEYSNEIAVMKELDHPNVVKLYEVIHDPSNNKLLMIMEYVEGGCVLAGSSPTQKIPIPESTAVKYFRDVVKGLEYLHFNRIVHGDLKPDNLLMSSSGKVKISDFGSARFCEKSDMIFATAGTPMFMAPEMCQGKQFNGFPGDIWALGICLFMFVFGKPPFLGATTYQIYEAIQHGELEFPPETPASGELKDLLSQLLCKDPGGRLSLEEIPTHPWVTRGGALPVLQTSNERAIQRVFEAMRKRNESGAKRPQPSTVPLAAPPEPVDMRKLVPDAEVRTFQDGEVIIAQGQVPEGLYYVQDGYVDLLLMPSEKKLVADEDFADAIDDEEDEDDEAVVTATANVLDCRRSPGSATGGEGEDEDDDEDEDEDEGDGQGGDEEAPGTPGRSRAKAKRVDDFMALFGSRLSDRVSPLGSSPGGSTPRGHSIAVTPRHGSQTLAPRHPSTTLAPRYGSQTLAVRHMSHLHGHHGDGPMRSQASASQPLPAALQYHHSSPAPLKARAGLGLGIGGPGTPHQYSHSGGAHSSSGRAGSHLSRSPSHGVAAGAASLTPRQASVTASPRHGTSPLAPPSGSLPNPPPASSLVTQASLNAVVSRLSLNGGGVQMRVPSHSSGASALGVTSLAVPGNAMVSSPSPLGLSCSLAADADVANEPEEGADAETLEDEVSMREPTDPSSGPPVGPGGSPGIDLLRPSASARDPAQSPFLVPSPPHTSPTASRRHLTQEPSFNPRLQRHDSGSRHPSRLSSTELASSGPGRIALLGRAASNRASRPSIDLEDSAGTSASGDAAHSPAAAIPVPTHSRRSASLLGPYGATGQPPPSSPPNAARHPSHVSGTFAGLVPVPPMPPASAQVPGAVSVPQKDDLLFLSPTESRRLSVTAGGNRSARKLGGAGVIVAAGTHPHPHPHALALAHPHASSPLSPTSSLGRPAPGSAEPGANVRPTSAQSAGTAGPGGSTRSLLAQAHLHGPDGTPVGGGGLASETLGPPKGMGLTSNSHSHDSLLSNADISMQVSSNSGGGRGGWRKERPAPVQVVTPPLPGGIIEVAAPTAAAVAAARGSNDRDSSAAGDEDVVHPPGTVGSAGGTSGAGSGTGSGAAPRGPPHPSVSRLRFGAHVGMRRAATHEPLADGSGRAFPMGPAHGGRDGGVDPARQEDYEDTEGGGHQGHDGQGDDETDGDGTDRYDMYDDGVSGPHVRHASTDVERMSRPTAPTYGNSAQPLQRFRNPMDRVKHRMRRHSTSSAQATSMLTRILGVSQGGAPLDRSSIQEWSTTSKLAQKAIQRSDSMHSRMAQMVLRAKQHAVRRKRRGSMQLITTRGPGSVVGELCIDGKPAPSPSTVVAKGPVTLLVIKNEKVNKYRNQPSVMAALHRSQNASLVQEAMERFVECEQEVVAVEVIRRTITTEPNMHMDIGDDEDPDEPHDDDDGYGEGEEGYGEGEEEYHYAEEGYGPGSPAVLYNQQGNPYGRDPYGNDPYANHDPYGYGGEETDHPSGGQLMADIYNA